MAYVKNKSQANVAIGARLAQARRALKLRSCDVSKELGIDDATMCHIEHGNRNIRAYEIVWFAKRYGVTYQWLLDGTSALA